MIICSEQATEGGHVGGMIAVLRKLYTRRVFYKIFDEGRITYSRKYIGSPRNTELLGNCNPPPSSSIGSSYTRFALDERFGNACRTFHVPSSKTSSEMRNPL